MTTLVAHRGYSSKYPENTMLAFRAAYDSGFRNIELDVHVNAEGVPVVVHNHIMVDGRPVTSGSYPELPHLAEVADWAAANAVTLFVDIKKESIAKHGRERVAKLVREACEGCIYIPVSFDFGVLPWFRELALYAGEGGEVISIDSVEGPLCGNIAAYTAQTQNEIRLLHALGARWVMVDDCGLAEGLSGEWLA